MANNLRRIRETKRFTLKEVEQQTGISYSVLSRIELGERDLSEYHIRILADFYKVPTDYILGRDTKTLPQTIVYKERDLNYQSIKEYMFRAPKEELIKIAGLIDGLLQNGSSSSHNTDNKLEPTTIFTGPKR